MTIQEFYKDFYRSRWNSTAYTNEKNSRSWYNFWTLVICAGFTFEKNDLLSLVQGGEDDYYRSFHRPEEGHYLCAVSDSNTQFCIAYEALVGRKPFIAKHCEYRNRGGFACHSFGKTQGRLVLGTRFLWKGCTVEVTSFKDTDHALIACAYKPKKGRYERAKIAKRFTITHKEWLANRP